MSVCGNPRRQRGRDHDLRRGGDSGGGRGEGLGTVIRSLPRRTGGCLESDRVCRVTPDSLLVIWRRATQGDW